MVNTALEDVRGRLKGVDERSLESFQNEWADEFYLSWYG